MWNSVDLKNSSKGAEVLANYERHKKAISQIKKGKLRIDNSKPYCPHFLKSPFFFSRPYQNQMRQISSDNRILIKKVGEIQGTDSQKKINDEYCKQYVGKNSMKYQMSLNIEHRISVLKHIMNENSSIEKRIQEAMPIISSQALKTDYEKQEQYKYQIITNSTRKSNCMLYLPPNVGTQQNHFRVQTTTNNQKRRRSQFQMPQNKQRPQTRQLNPNVNSQSQNNFDEFMEKLK